MSNIKIITLNANGVRSAAKKGLFDWLHQVKPDVVCLQETKAQHPEIDSNIYNMKNYFHFYHDAEKKGYSGVAIYSKHQPKKVITKLNFPLADQEGRFLQIDFEKFSVISLYLPSGTTGEIRQNCKYQFLDFWYEQLKKYLKQKREYIICGDWNIAHKAIDLKNWRANQKNSGFLPEERAFMDKVFDRLGFVDAFRVINQSADQYTWWSNRGRAWEKNVGWRIDYQVVTPGLKNKIKSADIYKSQRFSDHAPLIIEYNIAL